jgi:hypothetical protein
MSTDKLTIHEPAIAVPSVDDIRTAIRVLFEPGQVVELRGLGITGGEAPKKLTFVGFYDDHEKLAQDAVKVSDTEGIFGTYFTLQRIKPELLLRSPNAYRKAGKNDCTSDEDVTHYRWLPIDLDPARAAGISSTDEEKAAACAVVLRASEFFTSQGIDTIQGDSGNGYHLLARLDLHTSEKNLVQRTLALVADRFTTDAVSVDLTVFNPARIWKVYGTVAKKGFSSVERPHRAARLLQIPETGLEPISRELLETIAADIPAEPEKKPSRKASKHELEWAVEKLEEFMAACHVQHGGHVEFKNGFKWVLDVCPFNPEHINGCAIVTIADSGALGFRCLHNSCFTKKWVDFREYGEAVIGERFDFTEKAIPIDPKSIVTNPGHLGDMIRASEKVLDGIGLKYFHRGGLLVNTMYGRDLPEEKKLKRADDSVVIQMASDETIVRDLDERATFVFRKETKIGPVDKEVNVPGNLPAQIKDRVRSMPRDVPYLTLDMVSGAPVLLPSGRVHEILTARGNGFTRGSIYEERVLFVGSVGYRERFPDIKEHPTREDAVNGLKQFDQVFCRFPFVDLKEKLPWNQTASYSVVLSGILALVARPYLGSHAVPLHAVSAPMRRSGKTLIVEAACVCGLGHNPTPAHFSNEEELGKHLQPLIQSADRAILLDNIERPLQSSKLCILITASSMRDRVLQESRDVLLQNFTVFWATGNNLILAGDMTARALRCNINPELERPEEREFRFSPVALAHQLHPQLVMAALTALRAFVLAGLPWTLDRQPWGGFEEFDRLVSGCLVWCGYRDPYLTRKGIIEGDPMRMANQGILEDWYASYQSATISFAKIKEDAGEVYDALCFDGRWNGLHALHVLNKLADQPIGGYRLERMEGRSKWRVVKVDAGGRFEPDTLSSDEPERKVPF